MAPLVAQDLQRLIGGFGAHQVVVVPQHAGERIEVQGIVVDDQQAVAHLSRILYCLGMSRIDVIKKIAEQQPNDPFPRYGLAMEYKNAGRVEEAHATFVELQTRHPEYVAQYLMHGNLLASMHKLDEARQVYEHGIGVAQKKGDAHALGELTQARDGLPQED